MKSEREEQSDFNQFVFALVLILFLVTCGMVKILAGRIENLEARVQKLEHVR